MCSSHVVNFSTIEANFEGQSPPVENFRGAAVPQPPGSYAGAINESTSSYLLHTILSSARSAKSYCTVYKDNLVSPLLKLCFSPIFSSYPAAVTAVSEA